MKAFILRRLSVFIVLLAFSGTAFSYTVVLKNGKKLNGKLISEDQAMIVIEDSSGVKMNLKKTNVDLDQTAAVNAAEKKAEQDKALQEQKAKSAAVEESKAAKKPARKVTVEDLEKLREKYDLGSGTFREPEPGEENTTPPGEAAAENSEATTTAPAEDHAQTARDFRARLKELDDAYKDTQQECERLKNITIQTHILVDKDSGQELNMVETREETCNQAEEYKQLYNQLQEDYDNWAKTNNVLPGHLRE